MDARVESELVIGLVGPVGADLNRVSSAIETLLPKYSYNVLTHRLSRFFEFDHVRRVSSVHIDRSTEYSRVKSSMDAGDKLRRRSTIDAIMALFVAAEIRNTRVDAQTDETRPLARTAHLLRSLKRPEEVAKLREIYGARLLLISLFSSREDRLAYLEHDVGMTAEEATELIERDDAGGSHGQATAKTFELGDLFLDGGRSKQELEAMLERFFDLVFGSPLITPTADEHAMFAAFAASLRSGDLSRQVGAVVTTSGGTIVSEGANDAPRFGGEPYWPGPDDNRDIDRGFDSNEQIKRRMVTEILREFDALEAGDDVLEIAKRRLGRSGVLDITEYGRAVHAEMAALMNCTRLGAPTQDRWLYCTTFPCHNCAKHIVAAGIERVWFIEPYPKSRALELHRDSLTLSGRREKVEFQAFVGIGPRRYVELFSLRDLRGERIARKAGSGKIVEWDAKGASPALPDGVVSYLHREERATADLASMVSQDPPA